MHKAEAALRIDPPRSTTHSPHVRTTKRVSRRSLIYNCSLASEQLYYRNSPMTQTYSYEALFTNMTNQSPAEVVRLQVGTPRTHSGSRGISRVILQALRGPTPVMPSLPYENCPEAIQKLPSGPICIFVDGSRKDKDNGLENLLQRADIRRLGMPNWLGIHSFSSDSPSTLPFQ